MANHTILLIDYEPRSIERFKQPLSEAGYTVEVATDGLSGIEAFHRLNPDMVLVEAMIPKKHGFEVCQELKRTPHGRRTPVLITTGVYKGRKYRTQALHIYGCDEYIEKPIAPEQLLAVVGKFFGPSAAAAATAAETTTVSPVGGAALAAGDGDARSATPPRAPSEPSSPRAHPAKTSSTPTAVVKDFTEEEIMARLDAILPGGDFAPTPEIVEPEPLAAAPRPVEPEAEENPFLQMQAELSAELGALSAALALEPAPVFDPAPEPIQSDQAAAPSLLEALPIPELEQIPEVPAADDSPGQVVDFDSKRSRRHKRGGKKSHDRAAAPAPSQPAPAVETPKAELPEVAAPQLETPSAVIERREPFAVPPGSLVESELEGVAPKKSLPLWVWAAVIIAGLVAVYFTMLRGSGVRPEPVPAQPEAVNQTGGAGAERGADATAPRPAETGNANLVLNSVSVPAPRPRPPAETPSPAASREPAPAAPSPLAEQPASKPPASIEAPPRPAVSPKPAVTQPPVESAQAPAEPVAAPAGVDESVSGLETISDPGVRPSTPSLAPGTLVEAEDLDTAPVSLSRKLPTYSMQARQMRLQGTVVMKVLVNERGTVDDVVLVSGVPGADLNDSAIRAAKAWTYRPATKSGVPVKVWKIEQVAFKM